MGPQIVQLRALTYSVRTGESFKLVSYLSTKLWRSFKVRKLDVCGRPLFANPVTYIKCKMTNNLLGKSETVVLLNKQSFNLVYFICGERSIRVFEYHYKKLCIHIVI